VTAQPDGIQAAIETAETGVLEAVLSRGEPLVVVDSPPGAGKTGLVETVCALAASLGLRVLVATPKADQGFDLLLRLDRDYARVPAQLLHGRERRIPPRVGRIGLLRGRAPERDPRALVPGPGVVVTTAAKVLMAVDALAGGGFDLLIIDEAYQLTWREFAPFAHVAAQSLLIGDPGQLRPIVTADEAPFEAAAVKVHWPAPAELLRAHREVAAHRLPATRRLPADTVDLVAPAFYPELPFVSAASPRAITFAAAGMGGPVDDALDLLAAGASMVVLALPRLVAEHDPTDPELAEMAAQVAVRARARGGAWHDPTGARPDFELTDEHIGVADQHVASGAELRRQLRALGLSPATLVNTPEIWQGLERPLMVVKHPLSGTAEFGDFPLSPGRLCVMTSRHQLGCVIVTRDGVGDDLSEHVQDSSKRPSGARDHAWYGYRAHRYLWSALEGVGRVVRS
jgi:hypothetical protein